MRGRFIMSIIVLVLVSVGVGLTGGEFAAQAAPIVPAVQAISPPTGAHSVKPDPSQNFDLKLFDDCGEWKGTVAVSIQVVGGNDENYSEVSGTLYARCSGTSTLHDWVQCAGGTPEDVKDWSTGSSLSTDYTWGPCSYGLAAWVELCWQGPAGYGCGSTSVVSDPPRQS